MAEADERVEDATQRLFRAQVVDARHQVAVGHQPLPQSVVVRADPTHQPAEQRVDDVRVELQTTRFLITCSCRTTHNKVSHIPCSCRTTNGITYQRVSM